MTHEEEEAKAAIVRFYDALEDLLRGKGSGPMSDAWHHTPRVTSGHPMGDWARGWDEVWATWGEFAALGKESNAGGRIRDLKVVVYGDVAYATGVFTAAPALGGMQMNVTNIVHRDSGVWKVVHHHADRTPSMEGAYDKQAREA
jgi:ketosteroid isomerase-like protein